jgi:hypothetical protein
MNKEIGLVYLTEEDVSTVGYEPLTDEQFKEVAERMSEFFDESFQYALMSALEEVIGSKK